MSTVLCTRRLEWDAMHRIPGHEGKCAAFHGHRYVAELSCKAPSLDACGRVIDFGVIKEKIGGWIDEHWDHTAILMKDDPDPATLPIIASNHAMGRPVYLMSSPPSAENIVQELAAVAAPMLRELGIELVRIRLWETPNGSAEWSAA